MNTVKTSEADTSITPHTATRKANAVSTEDVNLNHHLKNGADAATEDMTLREAQATVDEWIRVIGKGYFSELTNMAVLTEEVGELARVIARTYGDQVAKPGDLRKGLAEELADVLWVVICLANQTGVDLTEALRRSIAKKTARDANRFSNRNL